MSMNVHYHSHIKSIYYHYWSHALYQFIVRPLLDFIRTLWVSPHCVFIIIYLSQFKDKYKTTVGYDPTSLANKASALPLSYAVVTQ